MKDDGPDRLASSADEPELRRMLEAGRSELPRDEQLTALARRLGPVLGGPGGGGPTGGAAPGGGRWAVAAKGLGAAAVLATSAWVASRALSPAANPSVPSIVATVAPTLSAIPSGAPLPSEPVVAASAPAPSPKAPPGAARPTKPAPPAADEVGLLELAQDQLAKSPAGALNLADQHARLYPHGLLRQEGAVIAIDALMRLGRRDAAEARADAFRSAYPGSTHLRRIAVILGHDA